MLLKVFGPISTYPRSLIIIREDANALVGNRGRLVCGGTSIFFLENISS